MVFNISTSYSNLALSQAFQRLNNTLVEVSEDLLGGPFGGTLSRDPSLAGDLLDDIIDSKYRLISKLGEGGMGTVYKVRHLLLNKEVAFKTFRYGNLSAEAWQRFQREAQTIARLNHANIVQVFDFGIAEANAPYYTMELLQGESLADCLTRCKRLTIPQALSTFAAVAAALSHAHNLGIVHRDIKPGNIFLDYSQNGKVVVKVVDFGLAKLATAASEATVQKETASGLVFGSPLYMSPEQADGRSIDQRTDIYSFGCAFYEALTGIAPFVGDSAFATVQKHSLEPIPKLAEHCPNGHFPAELDAFIGKVMAKERLERYQNFDDLLVDLQKLYQTIQGRSARISRNNLETVAAGGLQAEGGTKTSSKNAFEHTPKDFDQEAHHRRRGPDAGLFVLIAWAAIVVVASFMLFGESGLFSGFNSGSGRSQASVEKTDDVASSSSSIGIDTGSKARYYLSAIDARGRRQFKFPYGVKLGYLSWNGAKPVPAQGDVIVPAGVILHFFIGDETIAHPELLRGFHSDDIFGVTCGGQENLNKEVFESIVVNLSKLHKLDCAHAEFSCKYAPYLNRLKNLQVLELSDSNIDGLDLVQFTGLRNLMHLDAGQVPHISEVLAQLSGGNIVSLWLSGCALSEADLTAIAACPRLRNLNMRASDVSVDGLARLTKMPGLRSMTLTPRAFSPGLLKILSKFPHLEWLTIDDELWTSGQREQLARALSQTTVLNGSSGASVMR